MPGLVAAGDIGEETSCINFQEQVLPGAQYSTGDSRGSDTILETLGGAVAIFDFDGDGWPDLLFPGGGQFRGDSGDEIVGAPPTLWRGSADGNWSSLARAAGLAGQPPYSHGCAAADFNNDGFCDLLITGYGGVQLFQNHGDGTFDECSETSGIVDRGWSTGAAWGDLDGDGAADLYLVHYVEWSLAAHRECIARKLAKSEICGPKHYSDSDDRVFLNRGDGTFYDASAAVGLRTGGKGLGVVLGDVDLDGDLDVYVANDTTENFLYLNDGRGRLTEVGVLQGVAYDDDGRATGSMGVALADYNGDGLPDLWTTNFEREALALYRNLGGAQFHYVSRPAGVAAIGDAFVGWGTGFADFDRDGDLDIVVSNGHLPGYVPADEIPQLPVLFLNDGHGRFHPARHATKAYFSRPHSGRGLALGDLNRDGRIDLVISDLRESSAVLVNGTGDENHFLQIALVGTRSNRDALGAFAVLDTSAGSQLRQIVGGGSYLSQSELAMHWGCPAGAVLKRLTIHWPSGIVQVLDALPADGRLIIVEPVPGS